MKLLSPLITITAIIIIVIICLLFLYPKNTNSNINPNTNLDINVQSPQDKNQDNNFEIKKLDKPTSLFDTNDDNNNVFIQSQTNNELVIWEFIDKWVPKGNPPDCNTEFISKTPIDIELATSILYPGQIRGGDFKAHGGFRFDNSKNNDITVYVPHDSYVMDGVRYFENGELQYMFDLLDPCGVIYRFDHLMTLSPKFLELSENLKEPVEGDTRTTVLPLTFIKSGEIIATAVGMKNNVGVDFGLYDLRITNGVKLDPEWHDKQQAPYALCWLDYLTEPDKTIAKSLPGGDYKSGKTSAYCK